MNTTINPVMCPVNKLNSVISDKRDFDFCVEQLTSTKQHTIPHYGSINYSVFILVLVRYTVKRPFVDLFMIGLAINLQNSI